MGSSGAKGLGFLFFLLLHIGEDVLHVLIFLELVDELSEGLTLLRRHRLRVVRQADELSRGDLVAASSRYDWIWALAEKAP